MNKTENENKLKNWLDIFDYKNLRFHVKKNNC